MPFPDLELVFTHIIEGYDIPTPEGMLKVSEKPANELLLPLPYSLAENLWHTVYWQDLWLAKLAGEPTPSPMETWTADWKTPDKKEFKQLRKNFLEGLQQAKAMCQSGHYQVDEETARDLLTRIAVHASYHIGQMNLIKRTVRSANK